MTDWNDYYQQFIEAGVSPQMAYPEHSLSAALTPQRMTQLGFARMRLRSDPSGLVYWVGPGLQQTPDVWEAA